MSRVERAEAGSRLKVTAEDKKYTSAIRHPLARQWMLKSLLEVREQAAIADTRGDEQRWSAEVDRIADYLRRCGMKL